MTLVDAWIASVYRGVERRSRSTLAFAILGIVGAWLVVLHYRDVDAAAAAAAAAAAKKKTEPSSRATEDPPFRSMFSDPPILGFQLG
jgi:hypothetical protein